MERISSYRAEVERIASGVISREAPVRVGLVLVDHWFGDNWRGFAGKVLGALGVTTMRRLVMPPFHPSRVVRQIQFRRTSEGQLSLDEDSLPAHVKQPSGENQQRYVDRWGAPAVWAWCSRDVDVSDRAALMIYCVRDREDQEACYVSHVLRKGAWVIDRVVGGSQRDIQQLEIGRSLRTLFDTLFQDPDRV